MKVIGIESDGTVCVECGHCRGSGRIAAELLTEALDACTLGWQPTAAVGAQIGVSATHCANLLADLLRVSAVERRGSGSRHSPYEWRLALPQPEGDVSYRAITGVAYRLPDGTVWSAQNPARHMVFTELYAEVTQGFVLDDGRFVDRREGLAIAKANGQMIRKTPPEDRLFSEDLW